MLLLADQSLDAATVVIYLVALILLCLHTYYENQIKFIVISSLAYTALCFYDVRFVYFIPILLYGLFAKKQWTTAFLCLGASVVLFYGNPFTLVFIMVLSSVSYFFQYLEHKNRELEKNLKQIRDNSAELEIDLKNKNKNLIEKQDYEVHLATLKERNRIAREIHDNVGHMLSRSILQTGAMSAMNKDSGLAEPLADLKNTLSGAMDSIRSSVHDLHEESIDLQDRIQGIIMKLSDYEVQFEYDMGDQIPIGIKYCFISIVKEAISNIVKHSNADKIHLISREHPAFYQLSIQDNGTLIEIRPNIGMGLTTMQERVDALGGTFRITTDQGFRIFITIQKGDEEE
jgi:signal transduction histidine kinase